MTERTTVHLLRHGEVYNPDKILYGRLPEFHLSELGQQMACSPPKHWPVATWSRSVHRRWNVRGKRLRLSPRSSDSRR